LNSLRKNLKRRGGKEQSNDMYLCTALFSFT
jgi:hypothetical protein